MVFYCFELAHSGRSKCVRCSGAISDKSLRLRECHNQRIVFYHATCTPGKAVKWLNERWPGERGVLNAHSHLLLTPDEYYELQRICSANLVETTGAVKKRKRTARQTKEQQEKARADLLEVYPPGRKGVVTVKHDGFAFPHRITNHFVKVARCTPKFVELCEYQHSSETAYVGYRIMARRVWAKWDAPSKDPVLGLRHRVERQHITGMFGTARKCAPLPGRVQMSYVFEGDFDPWEGHCAFLTTELAEPTGEDVLRVRTVGGSLLARLAKEEVLASTVGDIVRQLEDCLGVDSCIDILLENVVLKQFDKIFPLLPENGSCLDLLAVFKTKDVLMDSDGRYYPKLLDLLDRASRQLKRPAVVSIDEALDQEPWI